jgi:hypothetical protein
MGRKRFIVPLFFPAVSGLAIGDGFSVTTTYSGGDAIVAQDILFTADYTGQSVREVMDELRTLLNSATGSTASMGIERNWWGNYFYIWDTDLVSITFGPPSTGNDASALFGFPAGTVPVIGGYVTGSEYAWKDSETIVIAPSNIGRSQPISLKEYNNKTVLILETAAEASHDDSNSSVSPAMLTMSGQQFGEWASTYAFKTIVAPAVHSTTKYQWIPALSLNSLYGRVPTDGFLISIRNLSAAGASKNITCRAWLSVER